MNKYVFEFTREGRNSFLALPKLIRIRIEKKLLFWGASPDPFVFAKQLVSYHNYYRFRIGDYRVIFTPKDQSHCVILLIIKVAHRGAVYE